MVNEYYLGAISYDAVRQKLDAQADQAWFKFADLPAARELPMQPTNTKWHFELLHDPKPVLAATKIPTLLLFGENDPWIPIDDTIALWFNILGARARDLLTIRQIPDANHFMAAISQVGPYGMHGTEVDAYPEAMRTWLGLLRLGEP